MPILIGILFGRAIGLLLGRVMLSHAALTVGVWLGVACASFWLVRQNVGAAAAPYAAVLGPLALLAWTLRHPARSRIKLWLFDGFYVWCRLGVAWAVVVAIGRLIAADGVVPVWAVRAAPVLAAGLACWLVQRGLVAWLRRSHLRAGDASMLDA